MTVDYIALRKKVGSKFLSKQEFITAIGQSTSFTYRLLNGHIVDTLTLKSIYKIAEVLKLSDAEIISIFFSKNTNSQNKN